MEEMNNTYFNDILTNDSLSYAELELIRYRNSTKLVFHRPVTLTAACLAILFAIVGTLGNLLTIAALTSCPKLRKAKTTPFVINLCTSHLLFCFFYLPLAASRYIHERWIFSREMCSIFPFFFYGIVGVSMTTITIIAINRYVFINHFKKYHRIFSDSNIGFMIVGCWVLSFVLLLPTLKGKWGTFGLEEHTFSCTILRKDGKTPKKILFIFGYLLPFCLIVASYACILYKYCKFMTVIKAFKKVGKRTAFNKWKEQTRIRKERATGTTLGSKKKRTQREVSAEYDEFRLTVVMMVILLSFLSCFSMHLIMSIIDKNYKYPDLHILASILVWMSSSMNPVIFVHVSRDYREAYYRLLCPKKRKPIIVTEECPEEMLDRENEGDNH